LKCAKNTKTKMDFIIFSKFLRETSGVAGE